MKNTGEVDVKLVVADYVSEQFDDNCLEAALAIFSTPQPPESSTRALKIHKREQLESDGKIQTDIKKLQILKKTVLDVQHKMTIQNKTFDSIIANMTAKNVEEFSADDKRLIHQELQMIPMQSPDCIDVNSDMTDDPMQDVLDSIFLLGN